MSNDTLIEKLSAERNLSDGELKELLDSKESDQSLFAAADRKRREIYGDEVYLRGLIEFTNHCRNNCYYCGIRCGNKSAERYRLGKEDILACCDEGYRLGFRTFVLQGGEDPYYTDAFICDIVSAIRTRFPDCAITLSIGEKSKERLLPSVFIISSGTSCLSTWISQSPSSSAAK